MSSAAPWWASTDADHLDPDQDPLAAHVAARGLGLVDDANEPTHGPGRDHDDHPGPDGGDHPGGGADATGPTAHDPAICGVCPVCRGWAGLEDRHPDVAVHLAEAARHVAMALAAFADAVDRGTRPDTASGAPSDGSSDATRTTDFTAIPLDDDRPTAP